jgi:hypothetical protein
MVHLCAPTTYAKQDKQLCDSKIYNFKHEGYHKVKCISKELGYRNNRGTRRRWFIPKFTLLRVLISVGAVWGCKAPQTPRRPHRILLEPSHQDGGLDPLWDLREVTEPAQSLGQSPQLNWRLPTQLATKASQRLGAISTTKLETPRTPQRLRQTPQLNWRPQQHH